MNPCSSAMKKKTCNLICILNWTWPLLLSSKPLSHWLRCLQSFPGLIVVIWSVKWYFLVDSPTFFWIQWDQDGKAVADGAAMVSDWAARGVWRAYRINCGLKFTAFISTNNTVGFHNYWVTMKLTLWQELMFIFPDRWSFIWIMLSKTDLLQRNLTRNRHRDGKKCI